MERQGLLCDQNPFKRWGEGGAPRRMIVAIETLASSPTGVLEFWGSGQTLSYSALMQLNSVSVPRSRIEVDCLLNPKIFAEKFSTSVERQFFQQLFRSTGRFWDFIARQTNLWPEIQISAGTINLQAAKRMPFVR
jgi:hypothetical protein